MPKEVRVFGFVSELQFPDARMDSVTAEYQSKRALRTVFEGNSDIVFRCVQRFDTVFENELHVVLYDTKHEIQKRIAFYLPVDFRGCGTERKLQGALRDIVGVFAFCPFHLQAGCLNLLEQAHALHDVCDIIADVNWRPAFFEIFRDLNNRYLVAEFIHPIRGCQSGETRSGNEYVFVWRGYHGSNINLLLHVFHPIMYVHHT